MIWDIHCLALLFQACVPFALLLILKSLSYLLLVWLHHWLWANISYSVCILGSFKLLLRCCLFVLSLNLFELCMQFSYFIILSVSLGWLRLDGRQSACESLSLLWLCSWRFLISINRYLSQKEIISLSLQRLFIWINLLFFFMLILCIVLIF